MKVIHKLGVLAAEKNVNENAGFLLTNKRGSYCSFFNSPSSRYNGLFYFDEKTMNMYRIIENIEIVNNSIVASLKNNFYFIERKKGVVFESFLMPKGYNSLIYELDFENEIDLILDCKDAYDNREWGRHYEIFEEEGCMVAKFTKKTDRREDASDGAEEFALYLAVKSNNNFYLKNDKWIDRSYPYDEERKSLPFKRYVYNALTLNGAKFVFTMSKSKDAAVKECLHIFENLNELKNQENLAFLDFLKNKSVKNIIKNDNLNKEIKIAYVNALYALSNLTVDMSNNYGVFAGLSWFFQFWSRDTLISLKALSKVNEKLAKKVFFRYLNKIGDDGRLLNLVGKHASIKLGNSDSHGWLFFRCNEFAEKINRNKETVNSIKIELQKFFNLRLKNFLEVEHKKKISTKLKFFYNIIKKKERENHRIIYEIESSLEKSLNGLLKFHTKDSFEMNDKLETWIDTEFGDDKRDGARIEIQALRLNMYKLVFELTQNQKYKILENILKNKIRQEFFNGKILADGLNDFTIRPNIFIAAYVYPELLTQKEWEVCFDNSLKNLWLDWGGLSTIDKNNPLFTEESTGEDIKSYHRGDSWFWINNLAALVLNRINKKKFDKYIQKIISASTEEILWKGCVGCHSELSSAKELKSEGCFNQAWSNAMFVEMIDEVFR